MENKEIREIYFFNDMDDSEIEALRGFDTDEGI